MLTKTLTIRKGLALVLAFSLVLTLFIGAMPLPSSDNDNGYPEYYQPDMATYAAEPSGGLALSFAAGNFPDWYEADEGDSLTFYQYVSYVREAQGSPPQAGLPVLDPEPEYLPYDDYPDAPGT